jgi:multiple sugar transport system substrate-binding protein
MGRAILFVALGIILLGAGGWFLFPNVRTDIVQSLPFFGSNSKKITLTYWGLWEPPEVIQPLLDEYQKQHTNITIQYEMRSPRDHYQTVNARLGGEGAPDIVRIHDSWIPFLKSKLAPIPKEIYTTQAYEDTFYPVNQVFSKQDNAYYGIPLMVDGLALIYNRNLFLDEGVVNPPKTWNEFRDLANRLTKKNSSGEIIQSGAALGYANNVDYFSDILGLMFAQNGVKFTDSSGKVSFHNSMSPIGSNLGVEAMKFYGLFATTEKTWDPQWRNSTEEFSAGKVAMIIVPSHRIHQIQSANPSFEMAVVAVPQLPVVGTQSQPVNWANYWTESVARTSPHIKEAWALVKWLAEKEQLSRLYQNATELRGFGEPYPRKDMATNLAGDPNTLPYVQQGATYTTWLMTAGTFNADINEKIISQLAIGVEDVARGGDALGQLQRAAEQVQIVIDSVKAKK